MSNLLRVSYVVEGTTDAIVIDALISDFLGGIDYVSRRIQPPESEFANHSGPLGGGWRGVLKWCKDFGESPGGIAKSTIFANMDCLIIHVDADISSEAELQTFQFGAPCPPAKDACDNIRNHIIQLLGGDLPQKVVLCIPAQAIEAWVLSTLHPDEARKYDPIECREDVARLLIGKPDKLVRDKDGSAKKQTDRYRAIAGKIVRQWKDATNMCEEAKRFEAESKTALQLALKVNGISNVNL